MNPDLELLHLYRPPPARVGKGGRAEFKRAQRRGVSIAELRLQRLLAEAGPSKRA